MRCGRLGLVRVSISLSRRVLLLVAMLILLVLLLVSSKAAQAGPAQPQPRVESTHHEQTIATVIYEPGSDSIRECHMIEVNYPEEKKAALQNISQVRPVHEVSFQQMLSTLLACQQLDEVRPPADLAALHGEHQSADETWSQLSMLFRGIIPGTKWCGRGDIAEGWHDMGPNLALDVCCRTHDLCPVKVKAYSRRYNLFNWSPYTKSHCKCDEEFYKCLKLVGTELSQTVGRMFFDVLQVQCVHQGRPCRSPDQHRQKQCLERQKSNGLRFSAPVMQFDQRMRRKRFTVNRCERGQA